MIKRVWDVLDTLLSVVGFATLVLLGVRWWRGLPVLPWVLPAVSAPAPKSTAAPGTAAMGSSATGASPAGAPTAYITMPPGMEAAEGAPAQGAAERGSNGAGGVPGAVSNAGPHDWASELAITINSSRYAKSLLDLAPANQKLPPKVHQAVAAAMKGLAPGQDLVLVCNVSVQYSGTGEVTLDQGGFRLVSSEREVFPAFATPFSSRDLKPLRATVLSGGKTTGDLVFPIKRGVQAGEINYSP